MAKNTSLEGLTPADINGLALTAKGLIDNPKTRKGFQRLLREDDPDVPLAEIDAEDTVRAATKPLADQVEKLTTELAQRDARERLQRLQRQPIEEGLLKSEAELPELEKYMKEKGFTPVQYAQAARHRMMEQQLAAPTPPSLHEAPSLLPKGDALKDWQKNPAMKAREEAHKFLSERRPGPRQH